ncbi:hypothetical protein [Sorangium sp. So ce1024]|uniref:hypothetical protein n=1 Tax=Sorangium sp. So ce1024 TaxID=3133327 RepID=UPI003F021A6C
MRKSGVTSCSVRGPGDGLLVVVALAAAVLGPGGCSLLIGAELSDRPDETADAGGEGGAGDGSGGGDLSRIGVGSGGGDEGDGGSGGGDEGDGGSGGGDEGDGGSGGGDEGDGGSGGGDEGEGEGGSGGAGGGAICHGHFADCDGDAARHCETNLWNNDAHCGACGNRCPEGTDCRNGECR